MASNLNSTCSLVSALSYLSPQYSQLGLASDITLQPYKVDMEAVPVLQVQRATCTCPWSRGPSAQGRHQISVLFLVFTAFARTTFRYVDEEQSFPTTGNCFHSQTVNSLLADSKVRSYGAQPNRCFSRKDGSGSLTSTEAGL